MKMRKIIIFHSFAFSAIYGTQYKIWDMHYCCLMRLSLFTRIKEVLCHLHTIGKWRKSFVRYNMRFCKIEDWNLIYIVTMSSLRDYMIRISFLCNAHTLLKRKYKYKVIRSYLRLDFTPETWKPLFSTKPKTCIRVYNVTYKTILRQIQTWIVLMYFVTQI